MKKFYIKSKATNKIGWTVLLKDDNKTYLYSRGKVEFLRKELTSSGIMCSDSIEVEFGNPSRIITYVNDIKRNV